MEWQSETIAENVEASRAYWERGTLLMGAESAGLKKRSGSHLMRVSIFTREGGGVVIKANAIKAVCCELRCDLA